MVNLKSKIEWTETTWNPITGCTKISPGCAFCYAERMSVRLKAMGKPAYRNGFDVALHEETFNYPFQIKKPKRIFVNSMSDLFHESVPNEVIFRLITVMKEASWHTFQILTKRAERLEQIDHFIEWPDNIWVGVSIETNNYSYRMDVLRSISSKIKFISFEPLLGRIENLDFSNIDWVIVGGESGPKARRMEPDWVIEIKEACVNQQIPFFFKQWGGTNKKKAGRLLEGQTWNEIPS